MESKPLRLLGTIILLWLAHNLPANAQQKTSIHNFRVADGKVTFDAVNPVDTAFITSATDVYTLGYSPFERPIPIEGKPNPSRDTLNFSAPLPPGVFPGKNFFTISLNRDTVFEDVYFIPNQIAQQGGQPIIEEIEPRGTLPGRVVTITGRNFGDDLNDLYIWFEEAGDTDLNQGLGQVLNPTPVTYLTSPDANGRQQIKFVVPGQNAVGESLEENFPDAWLEYELRTYVVVKGQPSANASVLSLVKSNYRTFFFVAVMLIFLAIIAIFWLLSIWMKRRGSTYKLKLKSLIIDQTTNRLSLAKCQALAWTIVLVISYTYFILLNYTILDQSVIPDFDPSLLVLMGITTGGLLVARTQDKSKNQKAEQAGTLHVSQNPSLWDLISENGTISLASLQLVLFTIVAIGMYIVYMTSSTLVETGLPTLPDTLLALMGISQGGYITGKTVEDNGAFQADLDQEIKAERQGNGGHVESTGQMQGDPRFPNRSQGQPQQNLQGQQLQPNPQGQQGQQIQHNTPRQQLKQNTQGQSHQGAQNQQIQHNTQGQEPQQPQNQQSLHNPQGEQQSQNPQKVQNQQGPQNQTNKFPNTSQQNQNPSEPNPPQNQPPAQNQTGSQNPKSPHSPQNNPPHNDPENPENQNPPQS